MNNVNLLGTKIDGQTYTAIVSDQATEGLAEVTFLKNGTTAGNGIGFRPDWHANAPSTSGTYTFSVARADLESLQTGSTNGTTRVYIRSNGVNSQFVYSNVNGTWSPSAPSTISASLIAAGDFFELAAGAVIGSGGFDGINSFIANVTITGPSGGNSSTVIATVDISATAIGTGEPV